MHVYVCVSMLHSWIRVVVSGRVCMYVCMHVHVYVCYMHVHFWIRVPVRGSVIGHKHLTDKSEACSTTSVRLFVYVDTHIHVHMHTYISGKLGHKHVSDN